MLEQVERKEFSARVASLHRQGVEPLVSHANNFSMMQWKSQDEVKAQAEYHKSVGEIKIRYFIERSS